MAADSTKPRRIRDGAARLLARLHVLKPEPDRAANNGQSDSFAKIATKGDFDGQVDALNGMLMADPGNCQAHCIKGVVYLENGLFLAGIQELKNAVYDAVQGRKPDCSLVDQYISIRHSHPMPGFSGSVYPEIRQAMADLGAGLFKEAEDCFARAAANARGK